MDVLCEDIVPEILVRLADCKTAIRLSTVCKRWYGVINSPDFRQRFNDHQKKKKECMQFTHVFRMENFFGGAFCLMDKLGGGEKCLEFLPWWKTMKVLASGGGLLALLVGSRHDELCVCNPLTKQWSLLPRRGSFAPFWTDFLGLAFNPDGTHFKVVIHIINTLPHERLHTRVFCSESGEWTRSSLRIRGASKKVYYNLRAECTQVGTTLYWMEGGKTPGLLLAHDPYEQYARTVKLPSCSVNCRLRRTGSVLGRLRLLQLRWKKKKKKEAGGVYSLKIWELVNDKHSYWSLVHRVRPTSFPPRTAMVVGFHPNDGDKLFVTTDRSDVCLYDIKSDAFQKLGHFPPWFSPEDIEDRLQTFTLLHPCSWPYPVPRFVNHRKRKELP